MKIRTNNSNLLKMSFRSLSVALLFAATTNCTTEETLAEPAAQPAQEVVETTPASDAGQGSLTVAGAFIEYRDGNLCADCTFILPEDATVVDGEKMGVKPGDVICLSQEFTYGAVEVVNVEGTENNPIVIGNCGE